jgi:hypothetical protein
LESLDRTNFTQHKFARASYAIKGTQECSAPGTKPHELEPEEVRMLQLDPKAEKIKHKELGGYVFKKPVNEWFAKLVRQFIEVVILRIGWAIHCLISHCLA